MTRIWWKQLGALVWKEFQEIRRDPSSYLVAIVLPIIFLLLFGYGVSLDAGILRVVVLDQSGGDNSVSLVSDFAHSPSFSTTSAKNMTEAGLLMSDSKVQGIIVIRENFDQRLAAGNTGDIQIIVDGSEPNNAAFIQTYSQELIANWQATAQPGGKLRQNAINLEPRYWYNPTAKSEYFLVPGSITVIMTLIGTLLTSLVFAREWERGTMESLITTPASRAQLLLGKLVPYFCMGMFGMIFCTVFTVVFFKVPFRGSYTALFIISSVFLLSALGQGLLISVTLRAQLVSAECGLFTGFLPALMLSGFVFDIESMSVPMQAVTKILPATYFNTCLRTIFMVGDDWSIFAPCLFFMALLAFILLALVYKKLTKSLDGK